MRKNIFIIIVFLFITNSVFAEKLKFKHFKLANGISVYLCEDRNMANVQGSVVLKVGSIDEPDEYTGLAHYLEHLLFKGTEQIGALDWEKEKALYEKIIQLYEQLSESKDKEERSRLEKEINKISIEASRYTRTNEFSNLIESLGGEGLNAATSYDMTYYYNSFPNVQMEKWLDLYSSRFINPIFRNFQSELETVYEEYNLYQDKAETHIRNFINENLYSATPYARNIIGLAEHLKNPRLSVLIEFYNKWYVSENMAVVLVGNFDSASTIPLIESKFGALKEKKSPARKLFEDRPFENNIRCSDRLSTYPRLVLGYKTVKRGHQDETALEFCSQILTNNMRTGLLDKLTLDGELQAAIAKTESQRNLGRFLVHTVPAYDIEIRAYESNRSTEKKITEEINKLIKGDIPDWLIKSVRESMLLQNKLQLENPEIKIACLRNLFTYNLPDDYYSKREKEISRLTKEELQIIAQKYLGEKHIRIAIEKGTPKKNKLDKPDIAPMEQPTSGFSEYAKQLQDISTPPLKKRYIRFSDVKRVKLYEGVVLHYTQNNVNDVFSLELEYGVGTRKMPKLKYATQLMDFAGIMPNIDAQTVMREFAELNSMISYSVSPNYFTIRLIGDEKNLVPICKLMTKQVIFPLLDEKKINLVKGSEYWKRQDEKTNIEELTSALVNYSIYKDRSPHIDRINIIDLLKMNISDLTGEIIRATNYELNIHYVGSKPLEEVTLDLMNNLPLKEGIKKSESPTINENVNYEKENIFLFPNKKAQQARVYFYINGPKYKIEDEYKYQAFEQYLSGDFNGILMEEIRENNAIAYTVYGSLQKPPLQDKTSFFLGHIGTQPDKLADAIDLYMNLLKDLPHYPDRIENIKTYLTQKNLSDKPMLREKSKTVNSWRQLGHERDPARMNIEKIETMSFEDILDFYNEHIKEKAITIVILGDEKRINIKQIEKNHSKIQILKNRDIFSRET